MYNYTSNPGYTQDAITLARATVARDPSITAEEAVRRAVAIMRYGDRVDVARAVKGVAR